jgi:hypothetical protein
MTVRNFFLLDQTDRRLLTEHIDAACARWHEDWCTRAARREAAVGCEAADMTLVQACRWRAGALPGGLRVAVGWTGKTSDAFISLLVGDCARAANGESAPAATNELERVAVEALITALLHDFLPSAKRSSVEWDLNEPSAEIFERAKGFFVARARMDDVDIVVVLPAPIIENYLASHSRPVARARGKLVSARSALASQTIPVDVRAGATELTLAELATLAVGDVIPLDQSLAQPLSVRIADGGRLCAGHLGTSGGRKAVQLTAVNKDDEG